MIRINLLGKKKVAKIPFGLDEKFERLGITMADIQELRPAFIRVVVILVGLYIADFVPTYLHDQRVAELDAELAKLTARSAELQKELSSKKDIRKQMEQLNKEESELRRQLDAVNALQQGRALAFKTLNDVVTQIDAVKKVWVDEFKFENRRVSMVGKSWEFFPVNDFVKSVTESTRYSNVVFKEILAEEPKGQMIQGVPEAMQKTKRFSLEFLVKEGE
ncbi:MAG TPA: PilN domain-containing protein [Bdellovibrionota bacterium]|jgi:Tfp pilus assembly protein PilN